MTADTLPRRFPGKSRREITSCTSGALRGKLCAMKMLSLPMSFAALLAGVFLLAAGCETESADSLDISISPSFAKVKSGGSVTLTASGWSNCEWSADQGQLSSTHGKSVTFIAAGLGSNTSCKVTASPLYGGSSTNSASVGSGTATIVVE